jgi:hypothetical protein
MFHVPILAIFSSVLLEGLIAHSMLDMHTALYPLANVSLSCIISFFVSFRYCFNEVKEPNKISRMMVTGRHKALG